MTERKNEPPGSKHAAPLPKLVVFLLVRVAVGALAGVAVAATLIATNAGGLLDLLDATGDKIAPAALLGIGFASLGGSLWAGVCVMLMLWDD